MIERHKYCLPQLTEGRWWHAMEVLLLPASDGAKVKRTGSVEAGQRWQVGATQRVLWRKKWGWQQGKHLIWKLSNGKQN